MVELDNLTIKELEKYISDAHNILAKKKTEQAEEALKWFDELLAIRSKNTNQDIEPYDNDECEEVEGYDGLTMSEGIALAIERKDIDVLCDETGRISKIYDDYITYDQGQEVATIWLERDKEERRVKKEEKEAEERLAQQQHEKEWADYWAQREKEDKVREVHNRRNRARNNSMFGGVAKNTAIFGGAAYLGYKL